MRSGLAPRQIGRRQVRPLVRGHASFENARVWHRSASGDKRQDAKIPPGHDSCRVACGDRGRRAATSSEVRQGRNAGQGTAAEALQFSQCLRGVRRGLRQDRRHQHLHQYRRRRKHRCRCFQRLALTGFATLGQIRNKPALPGAYVIGGAMNCVKPGRAANCENQRSRFGSFGLVTPSTPSQRRA